MAFQPGDDRVASMSATDWAVWIWTLDTDEVVAIAESRVTRSFTDPECEIYLHAETCPTG